MNLDLNPAFSEPIRIPTKPVLKQGYYNGGQMNGMTLHDFPTLPKPDEISPGTWENILQLEIKKL